MVDLHPSWHKDKMIRDEVHQQIRGLIRAGFNSTEIAMRVGCRVDTVTKQRRKMQDAE